MTSTSSLNLTHLLEQASPPTISASAPPWMRDSVDRLDAEGYRSGIYVLKSTFPGTLARDKPFSILQVLFLQIVDRLCLRRERGLMVFFRVQRFLLPRINCSFVPEEGFIHRFRAPGFGQ